MALSDFRPETAVVKFRGGSFDVRGLALDDLSVLVRTHLPDLDKLANLYSSIGKDLFARMAQDSFMLTILKEAPALAANIIALAADDPDSAETKARKLPLPIQVEALLTISRLTFEDYGGPKAFLALVMRMLPEVTSPASPDARTTARQ